MNEKLKETLLDNTNGKIFSSTLTIFKECMGILGIMGADKKVLDFMIEGMKTLKKQIKESIQDIEFKSIVGDLFDDIS